MLLFYVCFFCSKGADGDDAGIAESDAGGGALDNPLLIGGIAAGAVVAAALGLASCYGCKAKSKKT